MSVLVVLPSCWCRRQRIWRASVRRWMRRIAAAVPTTGLVAAGADEVSAAVAALFAGYGQEFQALSVQASAFHQQFVQALSSGAGSYLAAEAANASPLQTVRDDLLAAVNAPTEALLGRPLIGNGAIGTAVSPAPASVATLIMGGTGNPVPNSTYLTNIYNTYISRSSPRPPSRPV